MVNTDITHINKSYLESSVIFLSAKVFEDQKFWKPLLQNPLLYLWFVFPFRPHCKFCEDKVHICFVGNSAANIVPTHTRYPVNILVKLMNSTASVDDYHLVYCWKCESGAKKQVQKSENRYKSLICIWGLIWLVELHGINQIYRILPKSVWRKMTESKEKRQERNLGYGTLGNAHI